MFRLPNEVKGHIFAYDSFKTDHFDHVVHEINFIPVLTQLLIWADTRQDDDDRKWAGDILFLYRHYRQNQHWIVALNRRMKWNQFLDARLTRI